jgi:FeS assembly protein SufD
VRPFDEGLVQTLSESLGEPEWLKDSRLKALAEFASLPPERNPLYTKYASISGFDISKFGMATGKTPVDFRSLFSGFLTGKETNILLQGNETQVHAELDPETASKGVKLLPLHDALESDGELVKRLFEARLVKSGSDRYAAFVNAFFNSGTLVYVPKGMALSKPLRKMLVLDSPKSSVVDQTFIYADELSKIVFLEELYSKGSSGPSFVASTTEIHAKAGSHVDFSSIQLLDEETDHVSNRVTQIMNDSHATVSSLSLGAAVSRSRMNFLLDGRGSVAEGFEIFFTDSKQRYDFETNLIHNSRDSTGSTQARGVLKGESQSIFKGMIKIVKEAKNSRSYLAHHSMILERSARSDAVPGLEIDNNEVKATHSASVAQIDEEQLFYLMARGISENDALSMVVNGFLEPFAKELPMTYAVEFNRLMSIEMTNAVG